jgi:hypothetical protein
MCYPRFHRPQLRGTPPVTSDVVLVATSIVWGGPCQVMDRRCPPRHSRALAGAGLGPGRPLGEIMVVGQRRYNVALLARAVVATESTASRS